MFWPDINWDILISLCFVCASVCLTCRLFYRGGRDKEGSSEKEEGSEKERGSEKEGSNSRKRKRFSKKRTRFSITDFESNSDFQATLNTSTR